MRSKVCLTGDRLSTSFRKSDGTGMGSQEVRVVLGNCIDLTEILSEQNESVVSGGRERFFFSAVPPCAFIVLYGIFVIDLFFRLLAHKTVCISQQITWY